MLPILSVISIFGVVVQCCVAPLRGALPAVQKCRVSDFSGVEGFLVDVHGTLIRNGSQSPGAAEIIDSFSFHNTTYALFSNIALPPHDLVASLRSYPYNFDLPVNIDKYTLTSKVALANFLVRTVHPGARIFAVSYNDEERLAESLYRCLETSAQREVFSSWRFVTNGILDDPRVWIKDANVYPTYVVRSESRPMSKRGSSFQEQRQEEIADLLIKAGALHIVGANRNKSVDDDTTLRGFEQSAGRSGSRTVDFDLGKGGYGSNLMMEQALDMLRRCRPNITEKNVVVVGDGLSTDVATAVRAGARSVLVLTGEDNSVQDLVIGHPLRPTCYVPTLSELVMILEAFPETMQSSICDRTAEQESFQKQATTHVSIRPQVAHISSFGGGGCGGKCYSKDSTSEHDESEFLTDSLDIDDMPEDDDSSEVDASSSEDEEDGVSGCVSGCEDIEGSMSHYKRSGVLQRADRILRQRGHSATPSAAPSTPATHTIKKGDNGSINVNLHFNVRYA
eukprot:Lankesteria_metandrocarpae@DN4668_c2_g1_i1.p1